MEPKRNNSIDLLVPYVAERVKKLIKSMEARGFDPMVYETLRTTERQQWLYGQGRTVGACLRVGVPGKYARPGATVVTKTLQSMHLKGKAADIVSRSKLWNYPQFFASLKEEAEKVGLHTLGFEGCHVEWRG